LVVYVDPIIKKVFTTLIDNALRHGEKVSKIVFLCVQEKDDMIIAIQDDGIGIFDSEKESIFDHEYGKNTGIGLFLSKEILSITGLAISECGFFGAGARFEIVIPNGKYTFDYPDSL
jgi:K+-sensing histidine kinase KdpD